MVCRVNPNVMLSTFLLIYKNERGETFNIIYMNSLFSVMCFFMCKRKSIKKKITLGFL